MHADDYLKRYLPDFDTDRRRAELLSLSKEEVVELLLRTMKDARVMAMTADLLDAKLLRIVTIAGSPTLLPSVDEPPPNFPED